MRRKRIASGGKIIRWLSAKGGRVSAGKAERVLTVKAIRVLALTALLSSAILSIATLPVAEAARTEKYEEKFQRTEALAPDGKVSLTNISGDVSIIVWNRDEVKIDAVKVSEATSMEKAKENATRVKIDVKREDNGLIIETKYPEGRWTKNTLNVSVDYVLTLPAKAGVRVNSISGNVDADNVGGLIRLVTVSGNITVANSGSSELLNAVSGNITLRDVAGDVKARTVSGNIFIERAAGSLNVETVSGKVDAKELANTRSADVSSTSGSIFLEGDLNPAGSYSLESHSGDITVRVPGSAAFDFTCWNFSGEFASDFKIVSEPASKSKDSQRAIRGQVNGGGADLNLRTFSGDINLKKRG